MYHFVFVHLTAQIESISEYTLSGVMCDTIKGLKTVQERALLLPWEGELSPEM